MSNAKTPRVYLLCFDEPFGHARHYLGFSDYLDERLEHHRAGRGANLLKRAQEAGISWTLVRVWEGDRALERRLKNQNHRGRLCPRCSPKIRAKERTAERERTRARRAGQREEG